ncbi:MAG: hypothetical protein ACLTZW_03855 [Paratractidigestivibacter faecalis]
MMPLHQRPEIPTSGAIFFNGVEVTNQTDLNHVREHLGMVFSASISGRTKLSLRTSCL